MESVFNGLNVDGSVLQAICGVAIVCLVVFALWSMEQYGDVAEQWGKCPQKKKSCRLPFWIVEIPISLAQC